jgi:hypothetical protein
MEAAGIYPMPACRALTGHGGLEEVLVCSAGHVKNVPGRKAGLSGARWLARLLGCGLLAGGFIAPAGIKAARDVIRYRAGVSPVADPADPAAGQRAAGRRDQARPGGLPGRGQVRAGGDRGAGRRGAPRPGAGRPGQRGAMRAEIAGMPVALGGPVPGSTTR